MKIFVNDTNILIDLAKLDLLDDFSKLNAELYTTDLIINEIEESDQIVKIEKMIHDANLIVKTLSGNDYVDVISLVNNNRGLSFEDCSVWHFAKQQNGILLTGDAKLRKQALHNTIEVRGIIFVFDELVNQYIVEPNAAAKKLEELKKINNRLPLQEINSRIDKWSNFCKK